MENREFFIDDDGIKLHAKLDFPAAQQDKYPLCILIHGFTGHMEEDHLIGARDSMLANGIATLRVELYGHGKSEGLFMNHTLHKWMHNALAVIDYVKTLDFVTDLYLSGHSQGGLMTILVGGMCPDVFKALIPLSPALNIPVGAREGNLLGQPFDPMHVPETLEGWDGVVLKGNYIRVAQTVFPDESMKRFTGPVLIVHGNADESVPVEVSYDAAKIYENCELKIIEGDSHCFNFHLDEMKEAVREYMSRMVK